MQQSSAVAAGSSAGSTNNSPMNATFGSSHTNISRVLSQEEDMSSLSPRPLTIRNGLLLPLLLYNLLAAIEDSGGPLGRGREGGEVSGSAREGEVSESGREGKVSGSAREGE